MAKYSYRTQGTCSSQIDIEVENGIIKDVQFYGGCDGNLKAVAILVKGMKCDDAIARLSGIRCGMKRTSCPDQLATALKAIKDKENI